MNNMKIIMENWKKFEKETLSDSPAGSIYLIENQRPTKMCFREALDLVEETPEAFESFLEKWEKSIEYQLQTLNEVDLSALKQSPVLYLSTQVFMMIEKFKDKVVNYASKIISGANRIKQLAQKFEKSNPTIYKAGQLIGKVAIAFVAMYAMQHLFGTADAMAGNLMDDDQIVARAKKLLSVATQIAESSTEDPELQKIGTFFEKIASGEDYDTYYTLSTDQKDQLEAIANRDLRALKNMASEADSDALRRVADSALEVFTNASEIEIPQPPPQPTDAPIDLGVVLDQIEMSKDLEQVVDDDMMKLLKLASEKEQDPDLKKRAIDLLNKINP